VHLGEAMPEGTVAAGNRGHAPSQLQSRIANLVTDPFSETKSANSKDLLPKAAWGKVLDSLSAASIAATANNSLSPSYSEGRVRISNPPKINNSLILNLALPRSTKPSSRAIDNVTVASIAHTMIQERPIESLKRAVASYLLPTPSR